MASIPSTLPARSDALPVTRPRLAHIPELDGVRGIAALMVLCHHLLFTSVPHPEQWNGFVLFASRLSRAGGNGVDLFFVLSGFLITSLLVLDRSSPNFYWNFYWKRVLRILPLYVVALILLVAFSPAASSRNTAEYAALSLLFLANFAQIFHVASAGPFWTLAIEEQFYLIWPRFARRFTVSGLERFALVLVLACPALRLIDVAFGHYDFLFTFFHCDGLALGAMLACREIRRQAGPRPTPHPRNSGRLLLLFAAAVALTALPFAFAAETRAAHFAVAIQLSGISLLSYCVVAAAVQHTGAPLLAIFRSRLFTFFGLISYCLYIANGYVVSAYDWLRGPMQTGNMQQYATRAAAVFATTLIVCILSRYLIELPAMSLRRHVLRKP
jgi:peptidoglycan/LPS O-acetylase OafA/YrhL